jgi:hypothetical protein
LAKIGTLIPYDVLNDPGKFDEVLDELRNDATGFRSTAEYHELRQQYWGAPQSAFRSLDIRWDRRQAAVRFNWEASDSMQKACQLFELETDRLLRLTSFKHKLRFDRIFDPENDYLFLRVVGHWKIGLPLTPPFLELRDGQFAKVDGWHRLAVAVAAQVPVIPFWTCVPDAVAEPLASALRGRISTQ